MSKLFDPITISGVAIRNRIGMSPMSMYSAADGHVGATDPVHYGARSLGGAGLVFTGTVAVSPEGRITPADPGLWEDDQVAGLRTIAQSIRAGGGTPGIQIGHAGRKASTTVPWLGGRPKSDGRSLTREEGAWQTIAPAAVPYGDDKTHTPRAMEEQDIRRVISAFAAAARRADAAGFEVLELHAGHGYLIHEFYSPLANTREDQWGGSLSNRLRFAREVLRSVRAAWPPEKALALRFAVEDFHQDGWTSRDALALATMAVEEGVDMLDLMSFGGIAPGGAVPWDRNFTQEHAAIFKSALPQAVVAVSAQTAPGFQTSPAELEKLVEKEGADIVLLGRQLLADPHWPSRAAAALEDDRLLLPPQYEHWLTGRVPNVLNATA